MKNIPKKIYLNLNMTPQEVVETKDKDFHEATKTWEITWSEEQLREHDPEYIRKDAFIEKACGWLKSHYRDYMYNPTGERLEAFFGGDMCNDFENYMMEK